MKLRDRIKSLRRVKASELRPNPRNWRVHPEAQQNALRGVLAEVGIADAILTRELPDGTLEIIDGHLRADLDGSTKWPCLVLDVTEDEANKLLAALDPLAEMAETDDAKLSELLAEIDSDDWLETLLGGAEEEKETELRQLSTKPPPAMTWALIGLPTVRWGEVAEVVEMIAGIEESIVETTSNDG